jgi:hypothetical protein
VGRFGNKKALTTGELVVRIEVEVDPMIVFTLDPHGAGRVWNSGFARAAITGADSLNDTVQQLTSCGVECVRKAVPSLQLAGLQVTLDGTGETAEVVASGNVQFLKSEWDAVKQQASDGTAFVPRS